MLKTLLIILCVYWTIRFFRRFTAPIARPYAPPQPQSPPQSQVTTELVRDPMCETYIEKTSAIFRNSHYFCSETCAAKYKEKAA